MKNESHPLKNSVPLKNPVRFVTATSLFDGHDVSINIIRRLLVQQGAEVIHLGHNRSVLEIVDAAICEDAQGIAVSSYQGGHVLFFRYLVDLLRERGSSHTKVFGGGGGVILPTEIREIESHGVTRIYSTEDGRLMGVDGIVRDMLSKADFSTDRLTEANFEGLSRQDRGSIARLITHAELLPEGEAKEKLRERLVALRHAQPAPIIGITGTGGAGKSSLTDELVLRIVDRCPGRTVAVISVDPSRRKSGGALLGDRIRMNSLSSPRVYMRSLATRQAKSELSHATRDAVLVCQAAGFDLIIVETSGIGQGDVEITEVCDLPVYVMTSDFGASMQLEKIDMLDFADIVAINKFDRKGTEDAIRDVRTQFRRNRALGHDVRDEELPVVGTIASRFNESGVNSLYSILMRRLSEKCGVTLDPSVPGLADRSDRTDFTIIPRDRDKYLGEIAQTVRGYRKKVEDQVAVARRIGQIEGAIQALEECGQEDGALLELRDLRNFCSQRLLPESKRHLDGWDSLVQAYSGDHLVFNVRDKEIKLDLIHQTLAGTRMPKVVVPRYEDPGERLRYLCLENVPGEYPFTAGVFPLKRVDEDPKRQFAGEGGPERTNRRFHYLSRNDCAKRLSVAFDSPSLYGEDPDLRPDIFGKIGESGVSIATMDDMRKLFAGFDLCDPMTSVSMTINGPAPIILALFFNVAIEQQLAKFRTEKSRAPTAEEARMIEVHTLKTVRGTVQADIFKEDQGQNTCIFSIDFALRMMGDVQEFFIKHGVRNYYSVSISGYHIAEAGANPISQLAFTLANGFSYVEYYLSRGMPLDSFASNLSFFFSNGLDAEYSVIGRVARRIWAIVMKEKYGGNERSQKLKYHIQTSGRSLHAQEMDFNDIRTTLQALMAHLDHCNSLHTNSYDEAVTTPTEESVRRAMAIQLIISKEMGLAKSENLAQGSYIMELLTDLVEEAVLAEFDRLSLRGGVLGAMETGYQRGKIQEESMLYEMGKHTGELPIVGVNTFVNPNLDPKEFISKNKELARATPEEKKAQHESLIAFKNRHAGEAPAALERLKTVASGGGNIFAELLQTARCCSLGQITQALYEVGGRYRRGM